MCPVRCYRSNYKGHPCPFVRRSVEGDVRNKQLRTARLETTYTPPATEVQVGVSVSALEGENGSTDCAVERR
jgi:hypothetical protein